MEYEFAQEDVEGVVKQALQQVLADVQWDEEKVKGWTNSIIDHTLKGLQALSKPFKYMVTCLLMQKTGAGAHTAAGVYWDTRRDGLCNIPWENETIHAQVNVFGLSCSPSPQATE